MIIRKIFGIFMTALIFCAAILIGRVLWVHYMDQPWTRDGRVRADVINVAPDVSGFAPVELQDVPRGMSSSGVDSRPIDTPRSFIPDFAQPDDDDKYFKQLKKF